MNKKAVALLVIIVFASLFLASPSSSSPDAFGKTTIGASITSEWTWGSKLGSRYQCLGNGTVIQIDWYGHVAAGGGTRTIYAGIYNDSAGAPNKLLGYASTVVSEVWQWWSFTGLSISVTANQYYWLIVNWGQFNVEYRYDTGTTKQYAYQGDQKDSPPPNSAFGGASYRSRAMSIYATYRPITSDKTPPTYSNVGSNNTIAGSPSQFYAQWSDNYGLSGFTFGTNNTGTWKNDTWTAWKTKPTSAWSTVTKILNSTHGVQVAYRFWANDTSNNWANTGIQYVTTTYTTLRAVVIYSDFSYMLPGDFIDYSDATVFGVLQEAGIPYDLRPANEMADVKKLKEYSLIVFPLYLAYRLPDNVTNAVVAAVNAGVGAWAVDSPGDATEAGEERLPLFVSRLNNVIPIAYETMKPRLVANDTSLMNQFYAPGQYLGGPVGSALGVSRMSVYNTSRPYNEVVSVYNGSIYKGAGVVASVLGKGRTVWSIGVPVTWQIHGILTRLVRWAVNSPFYLELTDSPASGVSVQIRVDGDILDQYPQTFRDFMWKIGNITDARISLYIVSQATSAGEYLLAKQYPKNEYGSHSRTHANLPLLSWTALQGEMNGSKTDIEAQLGWSINGFAYPYNSYTKDTTAAAGAYDYVYIGMQNNLSVAYPDSVFIQRPPNAKTTALNTYTLLMTSVDDYGPLVEQGKDPAAVLQMWKNHFLFHAMQGAVGESNEVMVLLWHVKEMGDFGTAIYFNFLDWLVNNGAQFITAQKLVKDVKELEAIRLEYQKSGNGLSIVLDGSLSQGHPLRLFNSSDNIQSVVIDGQPWTNFREKVVTLPSLGPGKHKMDLTLGLAPTATIRGTVIDSKTNAPLQGVNATLDGTTSVLTAQDGTYSFPTVQLGSHTLTFKKAGYIDQTKYQDCPAQGEYVVDVLLQPVPKATIRGTVTDAKTGTPIQGVSVAADGSSTSTGADGSYSFNSLDLGSYSISFQKTGYITTTRTQNCPTEGEYVVDVALQPVPTATIRGTVTDSGTSNPIQNVNVTTGISSTLTAADGTYSLTVNLGSHTLVFSKIGYATETRSQDCPTEGEYTLNVSMRILTATIRGVVTDTRNGVPLAGVNVTVDGTTSALTVSDGTYAFTVVLGSHTLTYQKAGYFNEARTQNCPTEGEYIVNVAMSLLTATIRGTVADAQTGNPIQGVTVTCNGTSTVTISDGTYSFTLYLGVHTLTFSKTEYLTETRTQNCPAQGVYSVNVAMTPRTATVKGTVTDADSGTPISGVKVSTSGYQAFTNSSGVYVLQVRLGSYTLTFEKQGYYTKTASVNCPTEGTYTVDMALLLASTIFYSGFETGNFAEWSGRTGAVSIVSDVKYQGNYALKANFTARWRDAYAEKGPLTANPVYFRFYARFNTLPAEGTRFNLGQIYDTAFDSIAGIRIIRENGLMNVRLSRYRPTAVGTNARFDFAVNTWYCFELKFFEDPVAGEYRVYVNGQLLIVDGGLNTSGPDFSQIAVGHSSDDTPRVVIWIDEVKVAGSYIGPAVPTATVRGVVTDSKTNSPIQGATVTANGSSALTAADGSYLFTLNLGYYVMTFSKVGYVTQTKYQNCPTKGEYIVNATLQPIPTATIRGAVTDSKTGSPIQGVTVTANGTSTSTAADGSYSFTVNLGFYILTFQKTGYTTETRNQNCPSEGEYIVNISLVPRFATIAGTVTDFDTGLPIQGVRVSTSGYENLTDVNGVYTLVVKIGSYTLSFEKSGYYIKTTTVNCPTEGTYVVNMALVPVPPASVIFTSGYETGDYSEWSEKATEGAATITLVSDITHHGSYSSRATFTGAWQGAYSAKYSLSANPVYIRWYSRFDRLPANGQAFTMIETIDTGWNTIWDMDIERSSTGTVRLFFYRTRPGEGFHYYEYPFQPNTWYCFEVKFFNSASGGEYRVYLNGVEVITLTNLNTSGSSWMGIRLGRGSGYLSSLTTWTDCVQVATAYIGPELSGQASIADVPNSGGAAGTPILYWNVLVEANQKTTLSWITAQSGRALVDLIWSALTSWQVVALAALSVLSVYGFNRSFSHRRRARGLPAAVRFNFSGIIKSI